MEAGSGSNVVIGPSRSWGSSERYRALYKARAAGLDCCSHSRRHQNLLGVGLRTVCPSRSLNRYNSTLGLQRLIRYVWKLAAASASFRRSL